MAAGIDIKEAQTGAHRRAGLDDGDHDMSWRLLVATLSAAAATAVVALASIAWLAWRI